MDAVSFGTIDVQDGNTTYGSNELSRMTLELIRARSLLQLQPGLTCPVEDSVGVVEIAYPRDLTCDWWQTSLNPREGLLSHCQAFSLAVQIALGILDVAHATG